MPFQTDTEVGTQEDSWGLINRFVGVIVAALIAFLVVSFCNFLPAVFEMLEAM